MKSTVPQVFSTLGKRHIHQLAYNSTPRSPTHTNKQTGYHNSLQAMSRCVPLYLVTSVIHGDSF